MGTRAFGQSGNPETNVDGDTKPSTRIEPSILDIGSVSTGNESTIAGASDGDGDNSGYVDPSSLTSDSGDRDAPFGRFANGKPRKRSPNGNRGGNSTSGSGTGKRTSNSTASGDIAEILQVIHWGVGKLLKTSELEITDEEAQKFSAAITRVSDLYEVPLMDEKTRAWIMLGKVAAEIYIPRVGAVVMAKKRTTGPRVVTSIPNQNFA